MMSDKIKQYRILWLNAETPEIKRRIRRDWFKQDIDERCLEQYWEMVVSGWQ